MTTPPDTPADRRCLDLKGARERLCRTQVLLDDEREREWLQEAIDRVDRVAVLECPGWSKYDEPTVES